MTMDQVRFLLFLLLFLPLFLPLAVAAKSKCHQQYLAIKNKNLSYNYTQFDQTLDHGWRVLQRECKPQAIQLLKDYLAHHKTASFNRSELLSMHFHIAQLSGMTDQTAQAIKYAEFALLPEKIDRARSFRWNDYVFATIAFWQGDLRSLKHHRENMAADREKSKGNAVNLKFVDTMIKHFDKSYLYVLDHVE
jgi:hypothetical protein